MFPFNKNRLTAIREGIIGKGPVACWMSRDQRTADNWALSVAQALALEQGAPLVVLFCLVPEFLGAGRRQYKFLLNGLQEVDKNLARKNIPFYLLCGLPENVIPEWLRRNDIKLLITDFDPLRVKRTWVKKVAERIAVPFYEIDAHNIVPCRTASPKQEYGAYTIRPKIQRELEDYLEELPRLKTHPVAWRKNVPAIDWDIVAREIRADNAVTAVDWIRPGERAANKALASFIEDKLFLYAEGRNDPVRDGQSNLSPYLHFGQLSAQRIAREVRKADIQEEAKSSFLEELIIRRELADNFCFYNAGYDNFAGFPAWAKLTLDQHRNDPRQYLYSTGQLERAETHDDLWNAAQKEMVKRGKMHGYLRMYWAKKILEWTPAPEAALATAIYLNDRYELDGRDPNGYAGIAWSIGGVHDRAWNERSIFGKIRYMSYNGCKAKFSIKRYIEYVDSL